MSERVPGTYKEFVRGTRIVLPFFVSRQYYPPHDGRELTGLETGFHGGYAFSEFVLGLTQLLEGSSEVL